MDNEKAWEYALGIIKVDGLEPSADLLELIKKEKQGEIATDEIIRILSGKYKTEKNGSLNNR